MLMIVPPPAGRIASSTAVRAISSVPPTFSRVTACQPFARDRLRRHEVLPAGVVDEHVEPAVALEAGAHDPLRVGRLADVADHEGGAGADLLGRRREHFLAAAGDHDAGAARGEFARGGLAETRASARDERHTFVQNAFRKHQQISSSPAIRCR